MIVEKILLSEVSLQTNVVDKKIIIVGLTKLLCEVKDLIEGPYAVLWLETSPVCHFCV